MHLASLPRTAGALVVLSATLAIATPATTQESPLQKTARQHGPDARDSSDTKAVDAASLALAEFYQGSAWADFLDQVGGGWHVRWSAATSTPRAIYGSGIPLADWRGDSLEEGRRQANLLLAQRAELLGLGGSDFREIIGQRVGGNWSFVFDQFYQGLPVIGGRADVRVHSVGRVSMLGSTAWQIPAGFQVTPQLDADTALAIAWQASREVPTGAAQPVRPTQPQLVIYGDVESTQPTQPRLAWQVSFSNLAGDGSGRIGRFYVDALTGAVLAYVNDKHECGFAGCTHTRGASASPGSTGEPEATDASSLALPVVTTVTVRGWTRTGLDGFSPLVNAPLPGLELSVPGIGTVVTDQNGQFQINITSAKTISVSNLDGRHHQVIAGGSAPSGSFTVNPGVNTTIQLLTSGASFDEAAHTTTSWWVDRTNEFGRSILGNTSQLDTASNIAVTVNIGQTCNAFYSGNSINFYSAGGGCNNTAFSTVVAHEWGHGIDARYGGISQTNGLSEAWGDIVAFYLVDDPILGSGFSTAGVGIRNGNNTRQYPTGSGVHAQGESFMGFAWKLRDRLATTLGNRPAAIALTNDIVIGTIPADATDQQGAVLEVFLADDNDGNLNNGTPHYVDLAWACDQHSLPYPTLSAPANDDCANAIALVNGANGPFTNVNASTSAPAWPCASGGNDVWFTYFAPTAGTLTVSTCNLASYDSAIQILSGTCGSLTSVACNDDACSLRSTVSASVTPGLYYVRVGGYNGDTGPFDLDVSGPVGIDAAVEAYGTGCYDTTRAFYEFVPGTQFDLSGMAMKLSRVGNHYVASQAGAYIAPSAAATMLTLTDDDEEIVSLPGNIWYPGGTTNQLEVCSNGFISPVTGNGHDYSPTVAEWLGSTEARWGTWHDFNPAATGSGDVYFEQVGLLAIVTWLDVYSYNTTSPNTFQIQFHLLDSSVTFVWQSMVADGGVWLTGFTAAAPNTDLGATDISAALPGTFATNDQNLAPLAIAATLPTLGQACLLTTTNVPATSLLAVQILGFTRVDPGVDLGFLGMPNCRLYANPDSLEVMFPVGGTALHALSIPNNLSLMGAQLATQSAAFVNGANPAGLISSNGVELTLGL